LPSGDLLERIDDARWAVVNLRPGHPAKSSRALVFLVQGDSAVTMPGMTEDRQSWPCEHFSLNNPLGSDEQSDVAALLRRVAASLDERGRLDVADLVFHNTITDDGELWPSITVYFTQA
jgi:hypothetical protein